MRRIVTSLILYFFVISQSMATQSELTKSSKYNINSSSEFIFESYPNQELIPIRLLGAIKNAGLYHIPANMKLTTLLALAGGTTNDADIENILIGNDQDSSNKENQENKKSITIDLEEILKDNAKKDYTLVSNDIVLIKNKSPLISNDSFRMASILSLLLTTVLTAIVIKDKTD